MLNVGEPEAAGGDPQTASDGAEQSRAVGRPAPSAPTRSARERVAEMAEIVQVRLRRMADEMGAALGR